MRAYQDFREFLSVLEQHKQLLRITDPVKLEPDMAAASAAATRLGNRSPALLSTTLPAIRTHRS
jgi:UbiD family decarboxylase